VAKLPAVPSGLSTGLRNFLSALTTSVKTIKTESEAAKKAAADAMNILTASKMTSSTIPPKPTGVAANGAFTNILVTWDDPQYIEFSFAEVWRSSSTVLSTAVIVGTTNGNSFVNAVTEGSQYNYWVRFVSSSSVNGAYSSIAAGSTTSIAAIDLALTNPAGGSTLIPFGTVTTAYCHGAVGADAATCTAAGGTWIPVGAYMDNAFIKDASISSAKIASLSADKLYSSSAWINTADIVDAAITNAKVGSAAITTAKIADANITTAKIIDANITTAKIKDAAVDTLKIAGRAVTLPSGAYTAGAVTLTSTIQTYQTLSITNPNSFAIDYFITFGCTYNLNKAAYYIGEVWGALFQGGTTVYGYAPVHFGYDAIVRGNASGGTIITVSASTTTTLTARIQVAGIGSGDLQYRFIHAIGLKR
jgi:hypothetical protein